MGYASVDMKLKNPSGCKNIKRLFRNVLVNTQNLNNIKKIFSSSPKFSYRYLEIRINILILDFIVTKKTLHSNFILKCN